MSAEPLAFVSILFTAALNFLNLRTLEAIEKRIADLERGAEEADDRAGKEQKEEKRG